MKEHMEKILEALANKIAHPNTDDRLLADLALAAEACARRIGIIENPGKKGEVVN